MRSVFLGAPGSGKGTQAKIFCERLGLIHLSTGDLLRAAAAEGTETGLKAKEFMERGELVPDALVLKLLGERIGREDCREKGFVLDGYPRNLEQARDLDGVLDGIGVGIDAVVFLDVPKAAIIERLSGRRICPSCGAGYHVTNLPPKKEGFCDDCGSRLEQRADDSPATIENRIRVYEESTRSLIGYYEEKGLLRTIPAAGSVEEITGLLFEKVKGD
jgi:adenylate kinase